MALQFLKHTPWVFALFFALLALGWTQTRPRVVSQRSAALVPTVMVLLSFYCVLAGLGAAPAAIAAWVGGAAVAALVRGFTAPDSDIRYSRVNRSFDIPGSWRPLGLMMAIFFTKHAVAFMLAADPHRAVVPAFAGAVGLAYGVLGGLFLARAVLLWRIAMRDIAFLAGRHLGRLPIKLL